MPEIICAPITQSIGQLLLPAPIAARAGARTFLQPHCARPDFRYMGWLGGFCLLVRGGWENVQFIHDTCGSFELEYLDMHMSFYYIHMHTFWWIVLAGKLLLAGWTRVEPEWC